MCENSHSSIVVRPHFLGPVLLLNFYFCAAQLTKVQYWSLKGRALNVLPEHSQEAEDCLSRAIKHDPSQVDTWNSLGESYWKVGKIQQAHDCFSGCLAHVRLIPPALKCLALRRIF